MAKKRGSSQPPKQAENPEQTEQMKLAERLAEARQQNADLKGRLDQEHVKLTTLRNRNAELLDQVHIARRQLDDLHPLREGGPPPQPQMVARIASETLGPLLGLPTALMRATPVNVMRSFAAKNAGKLRRSAARQMLAGELTDGQSPWPAQNPAGTGNAIERILITLDVLETMAYAQIPKKTARS